MPLSLDFDVVESVVEAMSRLTALAASPSVAKLSTSFVAAGRQLALVGGPVRDAFLGRAVSDLDFATDATPDEILQVVEPISSATWDVGRDFGTIGAMIGDDRIEITTYRADEYDRETRKPIVAFGTRIEDDLLRRDFTINGLFERPETGEVIDYVGGLADLRAGTLRAIGEPAARFREDALRLLRAVVNFTRSSPVMPDT
jgi:poly(A) polymerase